MRAIRYAKAIWRNRATLWSRGRSVVEDWWIDVEWDASPPPTADGTGFTLSEYASSAEGPASEDMQKLRDILCEPNPLLLDLKMKTYERDDETKQGKRT